MGQQWLAQYKKSLKRVVENLLRCVEEEMARVRAIREELYYQERQKGAIYAAVMAATSRLMQDGEREVSFNYSTLEQLRRIEKVHAARLRRVCKKPRRA
jgi:rubrerythrin